MKITRVETIRVAEFPNLVWLRLHTDQGLAGLGETFFGAAAVEAYLHETAAPRLLGQSPLEIPRLMRMLVPYVGFAGTGVEMRGNSAIDIALWDLFGRVAGLPLCQALGGRARPRIRTYNTCAGSHYVRRVRGQATGNWGLGEGDRYDDLDAFLTRADELAGELLAEGITAMKIWPFDRAAEANGGLHITADELGRALDPFARIRRAVGDRIDIMVEFHSLWQITPAIRIARALAQFGTYWHEDPIRMDNLPALARYAAASTAPVCASETLGPRSAFRDLIASGAAGIIMLDLSWCGGLSEGRAIAAMADAAGLPVAPHDCTGPVVLAASTHLALHAPNALIQESVRAFHRTWYRELVTALPPIADGHIEVPDGPGLGLDLAPDLAARFTVATRVSEDA